MNSYKFPIRDIYKNPTRLISKVNIRQYLGSATEPAEKTSGINSANLDFQSKIIKETYLEKKAFRKLASKLRIGYKI